ncbi:hypothetical protein AYI92_21075 [Shewanella xiamenensis]|uniref:hypothetical protein n=1 Tax=Shewanella xiamenensis TaxID=332186 RepID=UPI001186BE67|nr:hypothetical protein [Shewanella xiamenensis]TVL11310.1 hypothetical protein AYI91_21090 [Shewanella xiamenensis]TVL12275.1 hypothetical protein AYI90_21145 [Shewanella xiamenensis]TVL19725.1 hypothetical protein AYI92_21075 [Shewanella xiamenensis]TVL25360.1 hypothetical protein AYI93_21145 [Shewanella xiamenensis]TVO94243.1 hypothetical protein AYI89_21195 [Shewanella xiamenensis]
MALTIRLTDEQEEKLQKLMEATGEATKSKAIIYMIENGEKLIKARQEYNELTSDIDTFFFAMENIKKHKIPF